MAIASPPHPTIGRRFPNGKSGGGGEKRKPLFRAHSVGSTPRVRLGGGWLRKAPLSKRICRRARLNQGSHSIRSTLRISACRFCEPANFPPHINESDLLITIAYSSRVSLGC